MDEVENLFLPISNLGPLGCQGWVVIPENVKKPKSLHSNANVSMQVCTRRPLFEQVTVRESKKSPCKRHMCDN